MQNRSPDARQLPPAHLTVRVPWHDSGWDGAVCGDPAANTSCLILPKIALSKSDEERKTAGQKLSVLQQSEFPPCVSERGAFMAAFAHSRVMRHPYAENSPETHGHFAATPFEHPAYSAACVPFRWMLKSNIESDEKTGTQGLSNELQIGYRRDREPTLKFNTNWLQDRQNQLALLDTFFSAVEPTSSLCFFYAKRTPMVDDPRRVIVGVGRVLGVGEAVEYRYKPGTPANPAVRCVLWERNVVHSIRPGFKDGFLLPYREILALAEDDPSIDLSDLTAFAPDEYFKNYSYGSELLPHDGAIASLVGCAAVIRRVRERVPGQWDAVLGWIDIELNRLWKARGAFPGLGSALTAFGLPQGNLIAYAIAAAQAAAKREWTEDPWELVDAVFDDPTSLPGNVASGIGAVWKAKWQQLPAERRALLKLLSRFSLDAHQVTRFYVKEERQAAKIDLTDAEILANPYRIYECDRRSQEPLAFAIIDRGMFPDPQIRRAFPVPAPSAVEESIDARRVRALVIDALEAASAEGHTLLPRSWMIGRIRARPMEPACPLDDDTLAVTEHTFAPLILPVALMDGRPALQLDRFVETKTIIGTNVTRRLGAPRHAAPYDWANEVAGGLPALGPQDGTESEEGRARAEKTAALEELFSSRICVLIGAAGTGKTTLLRMLCRLSEVESGRILLLAPTGKARVRLEQQTRRPGQGQTLAQFLMKWSRYDGSSGRYFPNARAPKCGEAKTVIIDECSMLTEEQLAAFFDALGPVDRVILVGDPRQLPPIGAGRPFVDVVRQLEPPDAEGSFPRRGRGYAELTIPMRHKGTNRDDLLVAAHFSGRPLDAGADEVWDRLANGTSETVRVVEWKDAADLHEKLIWELGHALNLGDPASDKLFEVACGGTVFEKTGDVFFWAAKNGAGGAAKSVDDWQVLGPVRASLHGVDAINRAIQGRFRGRARELATPEKFYLRKIPKPLGPNGLLWGDKVINVRNRGNRHTYPTTPNAYVANGDVGVVVGEYKTAKMKFFPENLEVEFNTQPGVAFKYWAREFGGDDANPELELAYALTVHKTQGSEFKLTFVVIPNPCRPLSRELLYTALTRHQERVVVLHQGPVAQLRRYSGEGSSEVAQRLTNLFRNADPRSVAVGSGQKFLEDWLIHRTERGELVRSKSEVIIADKLFARGIDYAYESPLTFADGIERFPDFTVVDDMTGRRFYWEHLGMLDKPGYAERWARKLVAYRASGVLPVEEGHGPQGTLITTRDDPGGALDSTKIAKVIDEVIRGV